MIKFFSNQKKSFWKSIVCICFMQLFCIAAIFAQITVTGTVSDRNETLPGVNVTVRGTTLGAVTDADGRYSINVPNNDAVLSFSFIGFVTQDIAVGIQRTIDVLLLEDTQDIDEVVVIGYGTQRRRDVAGSISTISTKDLDIQSATNVQNLLQGRMSGVSVATSGVPGRAPVVRIRGISTISDNTPLYVIDGFPTKSDVAANINPASIESVQVLKDAASASIYGAQAANGVILITTKQGKTGKAETEIKVNVGVQTPTNLPEMLNSQQWGEVLWNAMSNANLTPTHVQYGNGATPVIPEYILPYGASQVDLSTYNTGANQYMRANKVGTNWFEEVFTPAKTMNIDISTRGGGEDSRYFVNANYLSQDALVKYAGYDRLAIRGNSQFSVTRNVNFGTNLSVSYANYKGGDAAIAAAMQAPLLPVYDVMGNWAGTKADGLGDSVNPVASLYNQQNNTSETLNFLGNIFAEVNFLNYFQFKTTAGANLVNTASKSFNPTTYWNKADKNTFVNSLSVSRGNRLELVWSNTLTFSQRFNDHSINVLVGSEALTNKTGSLSASRSNFLVEDLDYRFLTRGETNINNGESGSEYAIFSLFSRLNYQYQDKYYVSAVIRRDGSSRFGINNRYGHFPGVSAAWRITEEDFMSSQNIFNDIKLRASYGVTGNSEIGNYAFASTYNTNVQHSSYPIQGEPNNVTMGIFKEAMGNPDLKWETTTQTNLGVDVTVLSNRVAMSLDYYHKYTKDILQRLTYPASAGRASAPYENIGEIKNNGLEFSVNYRNTAEQKDFTYDVGVILFGYRNEVTNLAANQFISTGDFNRTDVGLPIGSFYGFELDGIFQNQQEVDDHPTQTAKAIGRWRFKNVNDEDDVINDNDRTFIGNPHPKFEYSLNGRFYYKNFDLTLYVQGTYGNDLCFASKRGQTSLDFWADYFGKSTRILDTWSENNRNAKLPQINILNPNGESGRVTTYLIEDGSYLRVKFLELGYTLSPSILSTINVKHCRVYVNAENLLTFTKYNNFDPEVRSTNDMAKGVDSVERVPLAKVYSIGFNFIF